MKIIDNITSEPHQTFQIQIDGLDTYPEVELRYFSTVQIWAISVTYGDKEIFGVKCSLGTLHMVSFNAPFDFYFVDNSGAEIDPYKQDDFESQRISMIVLEPNDMKQIRGVTIE